MAHATWNSSVKARKISAWGPGEAGSRGLHGFDVGARPPEQCLGVGFAAPSRAPVPNWLQSAPTKSFRSQTWVQPPLPDTCPPLLVITRCTPARVCCRGPAGPSPAPSKRPLQDVEASLRLRPRPCCPLRSAILGQAGPGGVWLSQGHPECPSELSLTLHVSIAHSVPWWDERGHPEEARPTCPVPAPEPPASLSTHLHAPPGEFWVLLLKLRDELIIVHLRQRRDPSGSAPP